MIKTPLCIYDGDIKELQSGDTLNNIISLGIPSTPPLGTDLKLYYENYNSYINTLPTTVNSNTTSNGVCSGSSKYSSVDYYMAFDGSTNTGWITSGGQSNEYIQYQFNTPTIIQKYDIEPWSLDNFPSRSPKTWRFEASNDNINWVVLDTQTSFTSWVIHTKSSFIISNTTSYTYYRLYILFNVGSVGYTGVDDLVLYATVQIPRIQALNSSNQSLSVML